MSMDRIKNAMDLVVVMATEEIAARLNISETQALKKLLASKACENLYDDSLKLWWDGPSALADKFIEESIA